jgi:hypothetical protein
MRRSDTEPLLPQFHPDANSFGRSTAFKENISLSPVKALPYAPENKDPYNGYDPLLPDNLQQPMVHHANKLSQSSPAYRRLRDRPGTPMSRPEPVQRWNSQPVLHNITNNRRHSRHGEIQERRLLSEVQPAPPPPPKTPLNKEALTNTKVKTINNSTSHLRQVSEQSPTLTFSGNGSNNPRRQSSPLHRGSIHLAPITTSEPIAYWCGRFSTLNDRYRNEDLAAHLNTPKLSADHLHDGEANTRRMRRALESLHSLCTTGEARESFVLFQLQLASAYNNPDLGRPITARGSGREGLIVLGNNAEASPTATADTRAISEGRKMSFMERLLGRGTGRSRRSLIVS